ncbi:hypothetical protein BGZ88_005201 [Linnemannia elongata]|nr:hypothetical protein BGZ88_005201 [Linnemannia elongata]
MLTTTTTHDSLDDEDCKDFEQTQIKIDLQYRAMVYEAMGIRLVPLAKTEQGELTPVSLLQHEPITGKRPIRAHGMKPSELFIHDRRGVLQLMLDSDRLICSNDIDGERYFSVGNELLEKLRLGTSKKSSNLVCYHLFCDEIKGGVGTGPATAFIFYPSDTLVDGVTPFSGFRYVPDDTPASFHLEAPPQRDLREDIFGIGPVQLLRKPVDVELYSKKVKQSCEAVLEMLGDEDYSCYLKDRWCAINRLPPSRDQQHCELFGVPNFNLGMSDDSLRTFRPFNNIQFKTLQKARFDPDWANRSYYVHFNELEVDLVGIDTVADIQHGKVETSKTMRLIGPLPAPLRRAERPTGPTYKIEMSPDLNSVDEHKADGILGITNIIPLEPLTYNSPTPQSLCIINKRNSDNQSCYLAHGSVWCRGIKIDLIINKYDQVDLKCSYVEPAEFHDKFMNKKYNVGVLTEVDISHDRLVEVAVGVFEESFSDYRTLSKNCIAYMDMLAMRLSHYRVNRLPGFDVNGRKFEDYVFTEKERDEIQKSLNHYWNVQARMSAFHSKSRLDKLIHQVSRRGVEGHAVLLNAQ